MSGFLFNPNASVFVPGGTSAATPYTLSAACPSFSSVDKNEGFAAKQNVTGAAIASVAAPTSHSANSSSFHEAHAVTEPLDALTLEVENLKINQSQQGLVAGKQEFTKDESWLDETDEAEKDISADRATAGDANGEAGQGMADIAAPTPRANATIAAPAPAAKGLTAKELAAAASASRRSQPDGRPHLNVVFIGHVDAGKSTTCGNILYLTGGVDERTIEKYEREAREKNRESWFLAFVMDINEEERQKGKTVEVGRAYFSTPNRRFTLLDAPGHRAFVPNMIEGAAQADVGVLIISARKGEFETGFEKGGQTREHALLAKTLGVNQLVVAVNKMDESTCMWSQSRFEEIERKLTPFLKSCGFNPQKDVEFIPISGLIGQNLKDHVSRPGTKAYDPKAAWYSPEKPTLFELFDGLTPPDRNADDPLRVPILDGYRDNGIIALGKVEAGTIIPGMSCLLMPNKTKVKVLGVYFEDDEVSYANPGENVRVKLLGVEDDQLVNGAMLCSPDSPCPVVTSFIGRLGIVELLEHRPLITAGYSCVLHAHTAREEITFNRLLEVVDKKTKKKKKNPQFIKSDCMVTVEIQLQNPVCLEEFEKMPQLGRFTIRDEGKTIGIGRILQILKVV